MHVKGRALCRPDDSLVIMVLFNPGSRHSRDADAVTAHNDRLRFALGIQESAVHRFGILGAELEYMAYFDPLCGLQSAVAPRTPLTGFGQFEFAKFGSREVATEVN